MIGEWSEAKSGLDFTEVQFVFSPQSIKKSEGLESCRFCGQYVGSPLDGGGGWGGVIIVVNYVIQEVLPFSCFEP